MLAHHLALGMAEAGMVLPVSAEPLLAMAQGGSIPAALVHLLDGLPGWSADPHVIGFCQSLAVAMGLAGSLVLLRRLLVPETLGMVAQAILTVLLAAAGRWLVAMG
jgi:hypothetical protein